MNNSPFVFMIIVFVAMSVIITTAEPSPSERQEADSLKLSNCVELANQIGIDPNDEDRSSFIKDCYTGK